MQKVHKCNKFADFLGLGGRLIHEKNLKQKILWHCPFKAKHQRTQECTSVTSQNFIKILSLETIYKITTPLLRSEGGNLQTDAAQRFLFDPIPAKAKKLGLLSIYKFSLIITLETVSAGDHWDLKISRQMAPLLKQKLYNLKKYINRTKFRNK